MKGRIYDKLLTLLTGGAVIGGILYGLFCLLGPIVCILYCTLMVALLSWIGEDIRHVASEDFVE